MKKLTALLGVALALALMVSPASAIIGGEVDTEHTNVGAIMMVWPELDGITGRLCSGTLIHERALLTAAHCHTYIDNQGIGYDQLWVTFDQDPFAEDAQYLEVEDFIIHPDFGTGQGAHDIALVILAKPVVGIEPEALPAISYMNDVLKALNGKARRGLDLIVVGYGASQVLVVPEILLDATRSTGTVSFEQLLLFEIKSSRNSDLGDAHTNFGDSGGPLFHVDRQGNEVLVGLLGRTGGSVWDGPAMFHYRVDTAIARDFIEANLP
jgi:secreted trypsin-like serine protease